MPENSIDRHPEESQKKTESKWTEIQDAQQLLGELKDSRASLIKIPDKVDLRLKSGFFFGLALGVGFCIGFLTSLLILLGSISFYVYTRFPQLFK